jgi:hypothetical protein
MGPRFLRLTWRVPAALLAGLLAGLILISPAGAPPPTRNSASVIGGGGDFGSFQTYPRFGQWFGRGQTDSEPPVQSPMPIGGTVSDLHVFLTPAPGTGNGWTVTVRKNSADTSVTCTVSNTDTTCEDTGNSVSFSAGDLISVGANPTGAIPTENFIKWTAKFVAS